MIATRVADNLEALVSRNADRIKAILIIVVAMDHNDWFRMLAPALFQPLTFHVLGFFLLAFTFSQKRLSLRFVADRTARYLVPYWWALTAASLAFFFMFKPSGSATDLFLGWLSAAFFGNAPFVKSASGLLMLWFLPCLFGLCCLIAAFDSLQGRLARNTFTTLAIGTHLAIPFFPSAPMFYLPFGLAIAMNIFVLGLIWRTILPLRLPRVWGVIALATFAAASGYLVSVPVHLEIGTLDMAGISRPLVLVLQDVAGVAGVLTVAWVASLIRPINWLDAIGRHSLLVYLFHPIIYVLLGKLVAPPSYGLPSTTLFLYGCVTCCAAVGLALVMSIAVSRSAWLSAWITPRSWQQWPPAHGRLVGSS